MRQEPTLETYFPGPNAEALAAVAALAGGQGEPYLLLVGTSGTGKSHLLQAACQAAVRAQRQAHFIPLGFTGLDPALLEDLEWLDLVAIDDLHCIVGDPDWERALFTLFNRLRERGRALLCAVRTAPEALPFALPDLVSRLAWGPRYRLIPLAEGDCRQLLIESAHRRGLDLPPELVQFIMNHHARDPASLLELLARLDSLSLREQRPPSIQLLRRIMLDRP
ncbi:DnaA regulatory inactivator Hda [Caldichromatium japonicum]|uniref:DnaA regulatory inactivator Hda n=2 Tax=Caldichromatium japonicum TaxID=2699430 RepID=A0A6G7VGP0_9GAMM|nr:DnaA regulatory inactivator Hda [Caldichromatium japonicum]